LIPIGRMSSLDEITYASGANMQFHDESSDIDWKNWSEETFEEARRKGRLVLLDLTASWCHWCHVMDRTTYADRDIARLINDNFISVRVDIDKRPDISERYNRGGFPTTAFLSDQGESIWGATYIPPSDMKRIIGSILQAKRSGEIDQALRDCRMQNLDISRADEDRSPIGTSDLEEVFEDIFSAYDVENGGFGREPKFPQPDFVEVLLFRDREKEDLGVADAAITTLKNMTKGLYDAVEGGVFRYSVTQDWGTPHFEKMLETNLGFLRNTVHAYIQTDDEEFARSAKGTAEFLLRTLRDPRTGGFYGSQDADEEYYKLVIEARRLRGEPSIDKTIYAGWNAEAVSAMLTSGMLLGESEWVEAGLGAWRNAVARLWDSEMKLLRHVEGEDLFLFEDQVSFFHALIAVFYATGDESVIGLAEELIISVDKWFANTDGGYNDVMRARGAIGELDAPRRPLVDNSKWAFALALFGTITQNEAYIEKARSVLSSFTRAEIDAHGIFGAPYLRARWFLERRPVVVDVCACTEKRNEPMELCKSAMSLVHPAVVIRRSVDRNAARPYAVVCVRGKCFPRTESPDRLRGLLEAALADMR
jgi:uncharacterized protein YyaL (SSP411 family)